MPDWRMSIVLLRFGSQSWTELPAIRGCSDINCQREFGRGMSYDRIAKRLNADGVTGKAGGKFYASTVHKIVGNDLHA